jgi:hypothetical protein
MGESISIAALQSLLGSASAAESVSVVAGAPGCLVVDLDGGRIDPGIEMVQPCCTVIGLRRHAATPVPDIVDVVAGSDAELEVLRSAALNQPHAASVLVQVLRHNENASVAAGLLVESLAYSALQHGAGFGRWLERRKRRPQGVADTRDWILLDRSDARLTLTLNRPEKRNAYSAGMRDALCDALDLPIADPSIEAIVLRGAGPAFCAGGDLDEFGAARDAAAAHLTRTTRSAAMLIHRLRDRVECRVHGACIGAGIELPAFADRVIAEPDAFFQLPEVAMGLIPGAGGTVSIVNRIGRLRTAYLALSNQRVDATTARAWGLVDEIAA